MKSFFLASAAILIGLIGTILFLEAGLRFFPVRSSMALAPVSAEDPVLRYKPAQTYTYSTGRDFDAANKGTVNAQGYVSDFDYVADDPRPLIAVIGDSFIEARMVPFPLTVHESLRARLNDKIRVYNFGIGGSPLSQYLAFASMARDAYRPGFLIVSVVGNDFDESLPVYKNMPRYQYFVPDENGRLHPKLIGEYAPSWIKDAAASSALVRYLYFHLDIQNVVQAFLFSFRGREEKSAETAFAGNTDSAAPDERVARSKEAADAFLDLLPEYAGLGKNRILLVVDGIRHSIYSGTDERDLRETYFGIMRRYLIERAEKQGYEVLDLHPVFAADYAKNAQIFEFRRDGHWNAHAHGVVASAVLRSENMKAFLNEGGRLR